LEDSKIEKLNTIKVMGKIERFEDLDIWKEAVAIGVDIYHLTSRGKLEKDFSAKDQLRRAKASAGELRSNLFVLKEAQVIGESDNEKLQNKLLATSKNISGFIKYLKDFESKSVRKSDITNAL
jgi:23S rRNA-intervening sequence protein